MRVLLQLKVPLLEGRDRSQQLLAMRGKGAVHVFDFAVKILNVTNHNGISGGHVGLDFPNRFDQGADLR